MGDITRSIATAVTFAQPEDQLIVRLKEGDEGAFAEVFHLYRDLVYSLAYRLLSEKGEAKDVTQEVFVALFRKIHQFRGESSLKTWLYRVTVNQAASRNRWWRRRWSARTQPLELGLSNGEQELPLACQNPRPDRELYSQEIQKAVEEGLRRLPFEQRTAVTLRDVHGLSYEEIARVTEAEVGTVKSRICRGRERLREFLGPYLEGAKL